MTRSLTARVEALEAVAGGDKLVEWGPGMEDWPQMTEVEAVAIFRAIAQRGSRLPIVRLTDERKTRGRADEPLIGQLIALPLGPGL
jgi:hypothetical protein